MWTTMLTQIFLKCRSSELISSRTVEEDAAAQFHSTLFAQQLMSWCFFRNKRRKKKGLFIIQAQALQKILGCKPF
jgi:hypothetical protein